MVMLFVLIEVLKAVSLKLTLSLMVILPVLLKLALLKELAPLKLKLPLLKAVLLVALKSLLKMNAPPIQFRPTKSGVLFKSETAACIAKSRIGSVSRPFKRVARPRSGAIRPYANPS